MAQIARRLLIQGRVQGVWFRDWSVKTARELGISGWVRNRRDGSVEAQVEGTEDKVERFIELAHQGPPAADVERINSVPSEPGDSGSFEKRPSA